MTSNVGRGVVVGLVDCLISALVLFLSAQTFVFVSAERSRYRTEYACEGDNLHLECDGDSAVIHLIRVNYGRFSITVCNDHGRQDMSVNCMSPSSLRVMHSRCSNRRRCDVPANSTVFGDPCAGTDKYLVAHYRCVPVDPNGVVHSENGGAGGNSDADGFRGAVLVDQEALLPPAAAEPPSTTTPHMYSTVFIPKPPPPLKTAAPTPPPPPPPPPVPVSRRPTAPPQPASKTTSTTATAAATNNNVAGGGGGGGSRPAVNGDGFPDLGDERRRIDAYDVRRPGAADVLDAETSGPRLTAAVPEQTTETATAAAAAGSDDGRRRCPSLVDKRGVLWPATPAGHVASVACPSYSTPGVARWLCVVDGSDGTARWDGGHPDVSECRTRWVDDLFQLVKKTNSGSTGVGNGGSAVVPSGVASVAARRRPSTSSAAADAPGAGAFGTDPDPDPTEIARTMANAIRRSSRSMFGGDLETLAKLWQTLATGIEEMDPDIMTRASAKKLGSSVLTIAGQVLSSSHQSLAWQDLAKAKRSHFVASDLLAAFERLMFALASKADEDFVLSSEFVDIAAHKIPSGDDASGESEEEDGVAVVSLNSPSVLARPRQVLRFPAETDDDDDGDNDGDNEPHKFGWQHGSSNNRKKVSVKFDPAGFPGFLSNSASVLGKTSPSSGKNNYKGVVFASYRSLTPLAVEHRMSDRKFVLNSEVVSVNVGSRFHPTNLTKPVNMTFANLRTENFSSPTCVFWDYASSGWMTDGCTLLAHNATVTECRCDHLTHFGVLVDINDVRLGAEHWIALTVVTCVGCVVSIVSLALAVLTFALIPSLKGDRTTIHKNLCACLLVAEVVFLAGIGATSNRVACGVVAGLLHYFFLAAFCWMFFEGFQVYVLLVEVFQSERARVHVYYWLSYGLPLVVCVVSAAIDVDGYGTERHCWLRVDNYFIFSFVGPVLVILVCNVAFLGMACYVVCRHVSVTPGPKEQARLSAYGKRLQGALAIVILLGVTWTFGFMYVNEATVVMAYVFTVLNSFQGLFIFFFTCLCNEKVKKEYKRFFCWFDDGFSSSSTSRRRSSSVGHRHGGSPCLWRCCCLGSSSSSTSGTTSGELNHFNNQRKDKIPTSGTAAAYQQQHNLQQQGRFSPSHLASLGGVDLARLSGVTTSTRRTSLLPSTPTGGGGGSSAAVAARGKPHQSPVKLISNGTGPGGSRAIAGGIQPQHSSNRMSSRPGSTRSAAGGSVGSSPAPPEALGAGNVNPNAANNNKPQLQQDIVDPQQAGYKPNSPQLRLLLHRQSTPSTSGPGDHAARYENNQYLDLRHRRTAELEQLQNVYAEIDDVYDDRQRRREPAGDVPSTSSPDRADMSSFAV